MDIPEREGVFLDNGQVYVYVSLSPEIEALLADNEVSLLQELQREGADVKRASAPQDGPPPDTGFKSPELIILTAALAVPMISSGIARIIDVVGRNRRVVATARAYKPVLGADGKPVIGSDGKPVMEWEETPQLLEPAKTTQENLHVKAKVLTLEFELSGGSSEPKP